VVKPDQLLAGREADLAGDVVHLLAKLVQQVAPDVLAADRRVFGLGLRRPGVGGASRVGAGCLAGLLRAGLSLLGHHPRALAFRLGRRLACLFDHLLEILDDLGLLLAGLFAGVGLAEPLLDLAHPLDDLAKRAVFFFSLALALALTFARLL